VTLLLTAIARSACCCSDRRWSTPRPDAVPGPRGHGAGDAATEPLGRRRRRARRPCSRWQGSPSGLAGAVPPVDAGHLCRGSAAGGRILAVVSKTAGVAAISCCWGIGLPSLASVWRRWSGARARHDDRRQPRRPSAAVAVRLLAWSTVAQAGWVLVPLAAARSGDAVQPAPGDRRERRLPDRLRRRHPRPSFRGRRPARPAPSGGGGAHAEAYRGLARREPVAAGILGFALACLAGLPPGVMGPGGQGGRGACRWSTPGRGCSPSSRR
jgi:hypothetical protein